MAIRFQYNKTAMQQLKRQLSVRERALPTLKNKESALRVEVKKARDHADELDEQVQKKVTALEDISRLWNEYDKNLLAIKEVALHERTIAGVKIPVLEQVEFEEAPFSLFNAPSWFGDGITIIKELLSLILEREIFYRKMELLDMARKKTTQKVNLYEKVQIPGFEDAIRKIKRFLEDQENLSKAAQKIVKNRQQAAAEEV